MLCTDKQVLGKIGMACELSSKEHVRPGHLDLQLNASSVHGQYQISHNITIMEKILRDFRCNDCRFKKNGYDRCEMCKYVVTCNAILNLKGAFLYYQKKYLEACKEFEHILEVDRENQNALCNLHHVYLKLGDWERAKEYDQRYKRCSDDKNGKATYLGEQGFAILFDCHTKINELERYRRSVKMFEESLLISKDLLKEAGFPENQKGSDWELAILQWELWYAQSLQRMSNACKPVIDNDDLEHCYKKGMNTLKTIIEAKKHGHHNHVISIAYTCLGSFLSKKRWTGLAKLSEQLGLKTEFENSDLCFVKALKIQRNTEALIRYALSLKFKDVCRAIEHITEALEIDESADGNWFAWSVSSELHVYHVEKYTPFTDPELLKLAIKHGEKGASKNQTANLSVTLGKAYHYLARDHTPDKTEKQNLYLKALEHFLHALQHLDGDKQDSVHIAHGKCLLDMGQYRPALESFKRAVELGLDARRRISSSYSSMMKCYMKVLEEESNETEKYNLLETISYWLHVGATKGDLIQQMNPLKRKTAVTDQNKSQQVRVVSNENRNLSENQENERKRSRSFTSVDDIPSRKRGDTINSVRTATDHTGIPDEDKVVLDDKTAVNLDANDGQTGPVGYLNRNQENRWSHDHIGGKNHVTSEKDECSRKLRRQRSRSETLIDSLHDGKEPGDNMTSDTTYCEYTDREISKVIILDCKNAVRGNCPVNEKNVYFSDRDTKDDDARQRKECPCRKKFIDKKTGYNNQKEESSDWQTISPKALIEVIKFLLRKKTDKPEKLISWCISSENLKNFPDTVLDILLLIVPFQDRALTEDCLKHLYDQSHLSPSKRNRDRIGTGNQSLCHMDKLLRSWYVVEISDRIIEIQCKRCKNSKLWKEDCGHGLNHVALYSMIAKYCPSVAMEISDHLMTHDVRLAQILLEAFQKKCVSLASHDNNEIIEQHIMACISDLHYQACWLRSDNISVQHIMKHDNPYRKGRHPQYQIALNRCLSIREDREDALNQLVRISTVDEDSHMKLVKWQNTRDTIYFNYCRAESVSILPSKIPVKERLPKRRFPKYEYDFLVMNSDEDNDWVRFELLPTLEGRYGFKGCFQKRDYMPGTTILKEFENKVKESSKVLLVLTEKFKNDNFCCFQMHSALMKKLFIGTGKIIPLVATSGDEKDICEKVIPEELQHIVCFFVNRFDWEKLVRAIED